MSEPADHLERGEYDTLLSALLDAHRVQTELLAITEGQTVVPVDQLEFLARRARDLVQACIDVERGAA